MPCPIGPNLYRTDHKNFGLDQKKVIYDPLDRKKIFWTYRHTFFRRDFFNLRRDFGNDITST